MSDTKLFLSQFSLEELGEWFRPIISEELKKAHNKEDDEKMISRAEVAHMHGVSNQTVRNWTVEGKLKSYSNGGRRVLYKKSEVLASVKELKKYSHAI